ncbi:MAG TPA: hypothetical protein DCL21_04925 [Alphaproteobacteria bacterium]|nr:hypothetical protein [Alphaproteobacteria bacterium]
MKQEIRANRIKAWDNDNNIAEVSHFGSIEDSIVALKSLTNCYNMLNSEDCDNSHDGVKLKRSFHSAHCTESEGLFGCLRVHKSNDCTNCRDGSDLQNEEDYRGEPPFKLRVKLNFNKFLRYFHMPTLAI